MVNFLGRRITWLPEGIGYEADPRHAERLIGEWAMEDCRPVATPGLNHDDAVTKEMLEKKESVKLPPKEARAYRAAAARLNYLSLDRVELDAGI